MQTFLIDFLSNYTSESITLENTIMVLGIACILACYIFVVYRLVTKKIFYSKSFNIALAVIAVVTAAIILAVQSSIVISLGMVGALSIVRFRTAVKEPMDLCFLFWSIAVGICCGARVMEVCIYLICTFNNFGSDFEYAAGWKGSDDPRYESEGYKRRVRGD